MTARYAQAQKDTGRPAYGAGSAAAISRTMTPPSRRQADARIGNRPAGPDT
jgi:hypothetical protein